jgi:hypothetical protein
VGLLRRTKFDPVEPIDLPEFGVMLMPDPASIRAAKRGDVSWVVNIDGAIDEAEHALDHPTLEARGLADLMLGRYRGDVTEVARQRVDGMVQWGLTFARADENRLLERPPVAHMLYARELVNRTAMADNPFGQFLARARRVGFIYGRGGPGSVNLP